MSRLATLSFACLSLAYAAAAAPTPPPPPAPTPGQVQSTLPTQPAIQAPKEATPVAPLAPAPTMVEPGGPTVTLQGFDISGNTVFSTSVLEQQVADYLNKPVTLADIYKLADVLTNYYQSRGYSIARATVPQQKLDNGILHIQILEGQIGQLSVEGNTRTHTGVILGQSAALVPGQVFTDKAMDRAVLLVNDLPGIQAQAVLQPGSVFGTTDVVYKTQEQSYDGDISVDDYGRKSTGRTRFNASVDVDSLTGIGDRLSAAVTHAEHDLLNFGSLNYSLPMGPDGGRLTAGYNESDYRVSDPQFYSLDVRGRTENGSLGYQFPGLRSHDENFYWGLNWLHDGSINRSTVKGMPVDTLSNVNTLQLTFLYNRYGQDGSGSTYSGSFTSNGKQNPNGLDINAEAMRINLDGSWYRPLGNDWVFIGRAGGQWSSDTLPDIDKYSLGGPGSVQGYESAEARGDSGLSASGEVQHPLFSWPLTLGWFLDGGKVWTQGIYEHIAPDTSHPSGGTIKSIGSNETLTSSGLDLNFLSPARTWHAGIQWAYALGGYHPSDGDEGGHLWVSVGMSF